MQAAVDFPAGPNELELVLSPGKPPSGNQKPLAVDMAFLHAPNGFNVAPWKPAGVGENHILSPTLGPLAPFRDAFQVLAGLEQRHGWPNGDEAGNLLDNSMIVNGSGLSDGAGRTPRGLHGRAERGIPGGALALAGLRTRSHKTRGDKPLARLPAIRHA